MSELNLVIQTAFLGDLILSVPLLRRIKKIQPHRKLAVVCKKGLGTFLKADGIVDDFFEVEKSNRQSYQDAISEIRKYEVNNLYCVHRSTRSLLFAAQISARKKIGFSSFLGFWVFDETVDFCSEYHEVIRQFKILETTDEETRRYFLTEEKIIKDEMEFRIPEYFSFKKNERKLYSKRIAIFPGSVWETKKWTEEGFKSLALKFTEVGYQVDLHGAAVEKDLCERIATVSEKIKIYAGSFRIDQTIREVAGYDLVISNDSAPTHMAAYQGTPVLTIFGPTTSRMGFRPWTIDSTIIEDAGLSCRPCGPHGHKVCPLKHHNCMKNITAEDVFAAALQLLKKASS